MSLYNLCLDRVGRCLKKRSDVSKLQSELPKTVLRDLSRFIYVHLDPRTSMDYFAWRNESVDEIVEAGISFLECHNFCLANNPLPIDCFRVFDSDLFNAFDLFTDSEYYEYEIHKYYFLESTPAQREWPETYCGSCMRILMDQYHCSGFKYYAIQTVDRDGIFDLVLNRANYCYNCFVTPMYCFVPCDGDRYIDYANDQYVSY